MAKASRTQYAALPVNQGGGATQATITGVAAGASLMAFVVSKVENTAQDAPVAVTATRSGGAAASMTRIDTSADSPGLTTLKYEAFKALTAWKIDGLAAGDYTVAVSANGSAAAATLVGGVVELADAAQIIAFAMDANVDEVDSENGVSALPALTLPASGNFATDEVLLIGAQMYSDGVEDDVQVVTPAGWNLIGSQPDLRTGKMGFALLDRSLTTVDQVSVTFTTTQTNLYGRAGVLIALVASATPMTKKVRIVYGDDSLDTVSGVTLEVFANPAGDHVYTGSKLFKVTGLTWANEDIGGGDIRSVLEFTVPDSATWFTSGVTLQADDTVVAVGGIPGTGGNLFGSDGFVMGAVGTVVEVEA